MFHVSCLFVLVAPPRHLPRDRCRAAAANSASHPLFNHPWNSIGLPLAAVRPHFRPHGQPSIQEKSAFCILHHPLQSFLEVRACHRAARHDGPFVRLDSVEPETLHRVIALTTRHLHVAPRTCRTSSSLIAPETSLLFLNTSKLAPMSRCMCQWGMCSSLMPQQTSSSNSPSSSCRQSSIRSRSVASTTQMSVSVFSM